MEEQINIDFDAIAISDIKKRISSLDNRIKELQRKKRNQIAKLKRME